MPRMKSGPKHELARLREENDQLRAVSARLASSGDVQLRALFDCMPQLGWTASADGSIDFYNRGWYDYTGTTFAQMQGWGWQSVHDPELLPAVTARWLASIQQGVPFEMEFPLRRGDGVFRWFLTRVQPIRGEDGTVLRWVGINTDIHDRRQAAQAREGLQAAILGNMAEGVCLVRALDSTIVYTNPRFDSMFGYAPGELLGKPVVLLHHRDEAHSAQLAADAIIEELRLKGEATYEVHNVRKDGTSLWCRAKTCLLRHSGFGEVWVAVHDDITDRKRVAEELDQFFSMALDLLCIAGLDGFFKRINPSWEKVLGWSEPELLGRPWLDFVHPEDRELTVQAGNELGAGRPLLSFSNRYACKDGSYRWIEWRCAPVVEQGLIYCAARDITERRQVEEDQEALQRHLILTDRLVSVGTLAAGVGHEINNPLSYILANLDVALDELRALAEDSLSGRIGDLVELVTEAREGAERVKKIVRGLRTLSRGEQDHRNVIMDVGPALELAINMSSNEIRHRARLVKEFGATPLVDADDARLGQVFVNLLINAAQAIPEGNAEANEIRIVTTTDPAGRAVVEIRDSGAGIPKALLERIFEPFFTTKPVGVGTGLGLSICHNIVTELNGELSVTSEVGQGSTFRVVLPAAKRQVRVGEELVEQASELPGQSGFAHER